MYDKEQRANNIVLLYMLLKELHPDKIFNLETVKDDYERLLDEVMHMLRD